MDNNTPNPPADAPAPAATPAPPAPGLPAPTRTKLYALVAAGIVAAVLLWLAHTFPWLGSLLPAALQILTGNL